MYCGLAVVAGAEGMRSDILRTGYRLAPSSFLALLPTAAA